ncbi:DUF4167 domain-containing protein [Aureimonas phyllosphaerae]|uniref:DUF4167 domain-containing protein n=1 Tax=Aureimonas phyllosphaerae TaxID=1166078 RepID=UPI003A5BCA8E
MRPGQQQQNKQRMRGRGQRKGPNPLSRSFESNGPDVKIRGTAQHIADKYTTLARDAAAAGDRVMAENYLQHAEHYGRIVAAAQGQFQPSQPERDYADFDEEDGDEAQGADMGLGQPYAGGQDRQPNGYQGDRQPGQGDRQHGAERQGGDRPQGDRQNFRDNQNGRGDRRDHRDNRGDRPFQNRDGQNRDHQNRDGQNRDGFAREGGFRDGQNRDGQNREDRRDRDQRHPGTGPQPFPQAFETEGEGAAPRQDGQRFEGGRRESRRERARMNDRSGERRFEERFGRQRHGDDEPRTDAPAAEHRPQAETSVPAPVPAEIAPAPVAAAEPMAPQPSEPVAEAVSTDTTAGEPRGRGRRRRDAAVDDGAAIAPAAPSELVAAPVPQPEDAAPPRRRAAKPAVPVDAPTAGEDEAAPKRRAAKPRRKKDEGEGGDERSPALVGTDS